MSRQLAFLSVYFFRFPCIARLLWRVSLSPIFAFGGMVDYLWGSGYLSIYPLWTLDKSTIPHPFWALNF